MIKTKLNGLSFVLLLMGVILGGCDRDGEESVRPATLKFVFSESSISAFSEAIEDTPAFVSCTIDVSGTQVDLELSLSTQGEVYETSPIPFHEGEFLLKEFSILSQHKVILYESPQAGSTDATRVKKPMPLAFETTANNLTELTPEVLAPETNNQLSFLIVTNLADAGQQIPFNYTFEVIAKDAALGNVEWRRTYLMNDNRTISVPAGHAHYSFIASKEHYINHAQHYKSELLEGVDALSFEFIPESLEGFERVGGARVQFYLPDNQNMCKLYARMDVAEGYEILYQYADRSGWSHPWSTPLDDGAQYAEDVRFRVNVFGNIPYAQAVDYCEMLDFSRDSRVKSLDDVVLLAYTWCDIYNPNDPTNGFVDRYRVYHGNERNVEK